MNGINILETIEVTVAPYEMAPFFITFIILMILGGVADKKISKRGYIIGIAFMIVVFVTGILFATYRVPTGTKQYRCAIEDAMTFGEITEQYTILDVTVDESGAQIFLLEEK